MNMIGHEAISIDGHPESLSISVEPLQIRLIVAVAEECLMSLVSPYNDVIQNLEAIAAGACYSPDFILTERFK